MNIAFVRIPKNASRSIKGTNLFICGRHEPLSLMRSKYNFDLSFCVSRNPYSRFISAYCQGCSFLEEKKYPRFKEFGKYPTFKHFCLDEKNPFLYGKVGRLGKEDGIVKAIVTHVHFLPQVDWIDNSIDYILRLESLNVEWEKFLKTIKMRYVPLKTINRSIHSHWKHYYDKECAEAVYNYYKKDFLRFHYRKDSWRILNDYDI